MISPLPRMDHQIIKKNLNYTTNQFIKSNVHGTLESSTYVNHSKGHCMIGECTLPCCKGSLKVMCMEHWEVAPMLIIPKGIA
jgi:hypothetical protein